MTRPTKKKDSPAAEKSRRIVRAPTFVRLLADEAIVVDLGRDIEIACLTVGSPLTLQVAVASEEHDIVRSRIETSEELTEAGRIRMPPFTAMNTAMNILDNLVGNGQVDTDALRQAIDGMIANYAAKVESEGES